MGEYIVTVVYSPRGMSDTTMLESVQTVSSDTPGHALLDVMLRILEDNDFLTFWHSLLVEVLDGEGLVEHKRWERECDKCDDGWVVHPMDLDQFPCSCPKGQAVREKPEFPVYRDAQGREHAEF